MSDELGALLTELLTTIHKLDFKEPEVSFGGFAAGILYSIPLFMAIKLAVTFDCLLYK